MNRIWVKINGKQRDRNNNNNNNIECAVNYAEDELKS